MPKAKILITYKTNNKIVESDILKPIQTGRDISKEEFSGMLGDNTGDNISKLNDEFCEFAAIYWAWKNYQKLDNPDYIGFMHFRRHLIFSEKKYEHDKIEPVPFDMLGFKYLQDCIGSDENILKTIGDNDCIVAEPLAVNNPAYIKNNYEFYKHHLRIEDYETAIKIFKQKHPEYSDIIDEYNKLGSGYYYNMFVFKKNIFFEYCEWLFDLLFEVRKHLNIQNYDSYQKRQIAMIGERFTGIYIYKLIKENKLKIKELQVSFIKDTRYAKASDIFTYFRYKINHLLYKGDKKAYYKLKSDIELNRLTSPKKFLIS